MNSVVTVTGDGTTTAFPFAHGLSGSNFGGFAQANTSTRNFPIVARVDADSTNVNLHFDIAPTNGAVQDFNISAFTY
jgi:hypothetical protein